MAYAKKRLYQRMVVRREKVLHYQVRIDQQQMMVNLLEAIEKALHQGGLAAS